MKDHTTRSPVEELRQMSKGIEQAETVEAVEPLIGVVVNCDKVRIRKTPKVADDNVTTVINALSEVEVDEAASTEDFYKVHTAVGIEGFCMKKFIALRR